MATSNNQNQQNPNQNNQRTPFGTPMDLIMATLMRGIDKDGDRIEELLKEIRDELGSGSRGKAGDGFRRATDNEMWKSNPFKEHSQSAYTFDDEGMPKSAGQEFVEGLKAPFQMVMRHLRLGKYSAGHVRKKINDFRRDEDAKIAEMQQVADSQENIEVSPVDDFAEKMASFDADQANVGSWRDGSRNDGLNDFHLVEMVKSLKDISERVTSIDTFLKETFKPKRDLGTGENAGIDAATMAAMAGQATGQDSGGVWGGGFDFKRDGKPTGSTKPTGKPAAGKGVTGRIVDAAKKTATTAAKVGKAVGRSVPFLTGAAVLGESVLDHMSINEQEKAGTITKEQAEEQKFDSKAGAVGGLVGTGVGAALGTMTGPFAPVAVPALSIMGGYIGERAGSNIRGVGEAIDREREKDIDSVETDVTNLVTEELEIQKVSGVGGEFDTNSNRKLFRSQTKEKKLFGSETLGKWLSTEGTKTGETGIVMKESSTIGEDKTIKVFAERIAGGLLGGDQYNVRIIDGDKVEEIKVMPFQYDRLQAIAETGDEQALKQWVVRARETQRRLEDMRDPEIKRHRAKANEAQAMSPVMGSNEPAMQPAKTDSPVYKIDEDFNFMERMEPVKNQRSQTMDKLSKEISIMKEKEAQAIILTNNNQVINNNGSGEPAPTMTKGAPRMDSPFTKYLNRTLAFE